MSRKSNRSGQPMLLGMEADFSGVDTGDPSLEKELAEILGIGGSGTKQKKKQAKNSEMLLDHNILNMNVEDDIDEGDLDENDPELLAELNGMLDEDAEEVNVPESPVKSSTSADKVNTLENLRNLYQIAIKDAQTTNDTSKTRRYERSLKAIDDLLCRAKKGESVNEADFPPAVYVKANVQKPVVIEVKPVAVPRSQVPSPPKRSQHIKADEIMVTSSQQQPTPMKPKNDVIECLLQRQLEYKSAAFSAKSKDIQLAKGLMVVVKQFDEVIKDVRNGVQFDLDNLPPPPSQFKLSDLEAEEEVPEPKPEVKSVTSFEEELKIRRDFYNVSMEKAKAENNSSKMRRLARVVQQYDEAIVCCMKKTPYQYEELPPPPGKGPLSKNTPSVAPTVQVKVVDHSKASIPSTVNKTVQLLLQKQAQFRAAALKAKNENDLPLAKELLRQSKGFDQMIQASESGFPVDLSKIPALPTETDFNFELVNADLCETPEELKTDDKQTLFRKLQIALLEQIKKCKTYQTSVMKAGDVIGAKRFEGLANSCEKDLDGLKCLVARNADIPKFHYEYKIFSVTKSNPDLGENELSVEVIKAINLALPSGFNADQLDTYVVLELPFPNDAFQTFTTDTVRHTNNPEYGATTKFEVNLKSRVFQRVVKSKTLKADIYFRKGFLQKDKILGTCLVKLDGFETGCVIHEMYDLHENRKLIGGKLEMKLRLRNSIGGAKTENVKEKWLVIEDFNKNSERAAAFDEMSVSKVTEDVGSIDVLKYEVAEFRKKLSEAGNTGTVSSSLAASVRQKIREKEECIRRQEEAANSTDAGRRLCYMQYLGTLPARYASDAKKALGAGNRDKAQSLITKKRIVESELDRLRTKK